MVITTSLIDQVVSDVKDDLEVVFLFGATGTDSTTPAAGDTVLGGEVFRDNIDEFDKSVSNAVTASLRILTSEANGNALAEGGWFNASSSGTMWTRNTLNAINKTSDIQVYLDTTITLTVEET